METPKSIPISFLKFVATGSNKKYLKVALIAMVAQFIVFKILYPFADFFSDSYSYIFAAHEHLNVNIWPIGYSKFLSIFHSLTTSDTALVAFQYFFLELCALYFFFTSIYYHPLGRNEKRLVFVFLVFNPLFLYLCNYINSDPIFVALSLLWFTELIWITQRPNLYHIFFQAVLLFACFTIRNNAYYYPFVTVIAYILSKQKLYRKIVGVASGLILIISFIFYTQSESYKLTGARQYSLFTGWQLANNALYFFDNVDIDTNALPSLGAKEVYRLSVQFYNRIPEENRPIFKDYLRGYVGNYFIRQPESPLKVYFNNHFKISTYKSEVVSWGKASQVFEGFGDYIVKRNAFSYAKYFMLMNTRFYLLPPLEKLEVYNLGLTEVDPIAKEWFHYNSTDVRCVSPVLQSTVLFGFPILFMIINLFFFGTLIARLFSRNLKAVVKMDKMQVLVISLQLANVCFSLFATIIVLRYQIFPMVICFAASVGLLESISRKRVDAEKTRLGSLELGKGISTI